MSGPAHLRYYTRNRGDWDWRVELRVSSLRAWAAADLAWGAKLRILASSLVARMFGSFALWTRVEVAEDGRRVLHDTEFRKWKVVWFRSRETMHLLEDGHSLRIEGQQFIWPRMRRPEPFGPFEGRVLPSSTEAEYGFEVLGAPADFRSRLDGEVGVMDFAGEWLEGRFVLEAHCLQRLAQRREAERRENEASPASSQA